MPSSPLPPITESQILTSYLLPPSPLPTIIPYSTFLTLIPTTYRNNPEHAPAIKRLYRDLQFQRDITLSQVQENIERECGGPAATLRASLARRIAIEEGEVEDGRRRKRRRVQRRGSGTESEDEDQEGSDSDEERSVKEEELSSSDDEFSDPLRLQAQQAFYDDPSRGHPAAHVLPLPADMVAERVKLEGKSKFHTRESLLAAMENAAQSLDSEIVELEAQYERLKGDVKETVGGLSDLRYGRVTRRNDEVVGDTGGEYKDVLDALAQFRSSLKTNAGS